MFGLFKKYFAQKKEKEMRLLAGKIALDWAERRLRYAKSQKNVTKASMQKLDWNCQTLMQDNATSAQIAELDYIFGQLMLDWNPDEIKVPEFILDGEKVILW